MVNIKDLLPIGSVVILKKGKKRVMIFGVKQTDNNSGIEYDYISVLYPEGNLGDKAQFLFNHEDIDTVFFKGYHDSDRDRFLENLSKFYAKKQ